MPFNESTSKKEVQNTASTMERTWGPLAWIFCVFVSFVFILFFPDKVRVRDAGEKLPHDTGSSAGGTLKREGIYV